jgi:hypothetical protein
MQRDGWYAILNNFHKYVENHKKIFRIMINLVIMAKCLSSIGAVNHVVESDFLKGVIAMPARRALGKENRFSGKTFRLFRKRNQADAWFWKKYNGKTEELYERK